VAHEMWEELLQRMSKGNKLKSEGDKPRYDPGGSPDMLAKVLTRVALADGPVPRSAISKGSMLIRPSTLASATVGKAVDALAGEGLLTEEDSKKSGKPGPEIRPLRFSDKWAIIGIHIGQQHDGPDELAGIICGLDRKPLTDLLKDEVPRKGGQHDKRVLAEKIHALAESLLAQLDGPRKFLGVGVEIGGHVYRGVVEDSVHAGWSQEVDLYRILADVLSEIPELRGVPSVAENDVDALTIHGYYEGGSFDKLDVALVAVFRQGVGGGLIADGRMYRGFHGMAPEPGHLYAEHPEDNTLWKSPPTPSTADGGTFDDECLCSTKDRKKYGHVDCLAVPARIEGQLAARKGEKISLEKAAAAPLAVLRENALVLSEEAIVLRRAGRALGRSLAAIINIVNPGQLLLLLPEALATPLPQSSGAEYRAAVENEIDGAYSTGPADARNGNFSLPVQGYADNQIALYGAVAAATTVFNAFVEHARDRDGCHDSDEGTQRLTPSQRASRARAATGQPA
jgi:predicted NBD/HSP70 family sugar kinase